MWELLATIKEKINGLSGFQKILGFIFSFLSTFLVPLGPYLLAVSALVMVDLFTGIRAAKKRKEKIKSKGLRNSVLKIRDYFIAILLTEMMSQVFFNDLPITYITASYIGVIEFKSNLENLAATTGTDIWKKIKQYLPHGHKGSEKTTETDIRKGHNRGESGEDNPDDRTGQDLS